MAHFDDDGEILCEACGQQPATGVVCIGEDGAPDYREIWHCDDCWEHRHWELTKLLKGETKWQRH